MTKRTVHRVARIYLISICIWSALSLLTGWNYLIFDHSVNIHSTLGEMLYLAEARGLAYALLTPLIFYIVGHFSAGTGKRLRYFLIYGLGAAPFTVIYACIRWIILPPWNPVLERFVPRSEASPLSLVQDGF